MVLHPPTGMTHWVYISSAPIRASDGTLLGAVTSLSDITPLHELEEQREDLMRAVSHDLRSPLTSILGQAQLLRKKLDATGRDDRERRSVDAIITGAMRMNTMIQDLVDSARMESGQLRLQKQPIELNTFLVDMLERNSTAMAVQRVRLGIPYDLPPVNADPSRLERILLTWYPMPQVLLLRRRWINAESERGCKGIGERPGLVFYGISQICFNASIAQRYPQDGVGAVYHADAGGGARREDLG